MIKEEPSVEMSIKNDLKEKRPSCCEPQRKVIDKGNSKQNNERNKLHAVDKQKRGQHVERARTVF